MKLQRCTLISHAGRAFGWLLLLLLLVLDGFVAGFRLGFIEDEEEDWFALARMAAARAVTAFVVATVGAGRVILLIRRVPVGLGDSAGVAFLFLGSVF